LESKQHRCSTCNQPGHNTSSCNMMTVFSVINKYIRERGSKMFEGAVVLTPEIQGELSHDIFKTGLQVADIDAGRDAPIFPDGFEAGSFNGDIEPDVDLTIGEPEARPVPATKKAKVAKRSSTAYRQRQPVDTSDGSSDSEDPFPLPLPLRQGRKGKGKGMAKGKGNGKRPYSRKQQGRNDIGDDDDDSDDDVDDVMDLCSESSSDKSSKK